MSRASAERRGFRRRSAAVLWSIFERVRAGLKARKLITHAELFSIAGGRDRQEQEAAVFDFAVVDEAQDISVAHLRFFAALGRRPSQRSVFRRRPRAAHLPAAVFVESAGRRYSRPLADACASITARPTKSARRRTGCSARR